MAPKTAPGWERSIREALAKLPEQARLATVGLYVLMRQDFEDKFPTAGQDAPSAALLPPNRPAILAGREAASVAACVGRLMAVGLVVEAEDGGGFDLPHVRRICEIRARDRGYKTKSPANPRQVGIPTQGRSEGGSEVRSETPPPAASPAPFPSPASPFLYPTPNTTPRPVLPQAPEPDVEEEEPPSMAKRHPSPDEAIYEVYPKHVARKDALRAIRNARRDVAQRGIIDPFGYLLERTQKYTNVRAEIHELYPNEKKWTPHPATWFNRGSYDDDPEQWAVLYEQPKSAPKTARAAEIERFGKAMDSILGATSDDNPRIGAVHEGAQRLLPGGHRGAGPAGGGDRPANGRPHRDRRAEDPQAASRLFQREDDH